MTAYEKGESDGKTAKLTVRVPHELHTQFKVVAALERQSMEALLRSWIERYVEDAKNEPLASRKAPLEEFVPGELAAEGGGVGGEARGDKNSARDGQEASAGDVHRPAARVEVRPDPKVK